MLVTNSFDIALAFIDLGQWMIAKVPVETFALTDSFKITLIDSIEDESDLGMGLSLLVIALLSMIFSFVMAGIIYVVAWSRIKVFFMVLSEAKNRSLLFLILYRNNVIFYFFGKTA